MATLDARLRGLEVKRQRRLVGPLAGATLVDSEVAALMNATAHHGDRGAYLAGVLKRLEDGTTIPEDMACLRSVAALRVIHKLETET